MYIQQLYTNCLAEAAYYIESDGEAAIIDPLRETGPYIELANQRGAVIRYVFETHFHADFVSGHLDLARISGAKIVYGPTAAANYKIYVATDGERFPLGNVEIELLHTPGHTIESSCFLLYDEQKTPYALFSGDTVFVGDVGRPDLAVNKDLTKENLAGMLYDSIQTKILTLPDEVILYPGHGAGSACGKNIGKETTSTIGLQKKLNYALQPMPKEAFVHAVTSGLEEPPNYFFTDAAINKQGYNPIDEVMEKNLRKLTPVEFAREQAKGALVLDTRKGEEFMKGFIPGALNVGLNGQFAVWVGSLVSPETPLLLVTEPGREEEAVLRLARVGFENIAGYLDGGFDAWIDAGLGHDYLPSVTPLWLETNTSEAGQLLDVRTTGERNQGMLKRSIHIPLSQLEKNLDKINRNDNCFVYCVSGYRSPIACSILKRNGFDKVANIAGGFNQVKQEAANLLATLVVV